MNDFKRNIIHQPKRVANPDRIVATSCLIKGFFHLDRTLDAMSQRT